MDSIDTLKSSLPLDIIQLILKLLSCRDFLNLSCTSQFWQSQCSSPLIWRYLVSRDFGLFYGFNGYNLPDPVEAEEKIPIRSVVNIKGNYAKTRQLTLSQTDEDENSKNWSELYKENYDMNNITKVKFNFMPKGNSEASAREGHDIVLIGDYMFMYGGFVPDCNVYVMNTKKVDPYWEALTYLKSNPFPRVRYGHTLTAVEKYGMIIMFGGLTQGGYHGELNEIWVLHLRSKDAMSENSNEEKEEEKPTFNDFDYPFVLQWEKPEYPSGPRPTPRGYHSACLSEDGDKIYFYGGISGGTSIGSLAVLDIPSWSWINIPAISGKTLNVMGHSSYMINSKLWLVSGGYGGDLCRDGGDYRSVYTIDVSSLQTGAYISKLRLLDNNFQNIHSMGRCHASVLVGENIVCFGGSINFSNSVSIINTRTLTITIPKLSGDNPPKLMSTKSIFKDGKIYYWGGFSNKRRNIGDLWVVDLKDKTEGEEINVEERIFEDDDEDYPGYLLLQRALQDLINVEDENEEYDENEQARPCQIQ